MSIQYKLTALNGRIIAIDGPAGSGKSTTARMLAEKLGFVYLDTGAMYRAITWFALRNDLPTDNGELLETIARKLKIEFKMDGEINRVYLNGSEITDEIRTPEVTRNVSAVSAHPGVRKVMVENQKKIGKKGNVVAEGRDTTSVVFPDADIKVYLDASLEERARRRLLELSRKGISTSLEQQKKELAKRDEYDSNRKISPLKKTRDAIMVDTSNLTISEQVERIIILIKSRLRVR